MAGLAQLQLEAYTAVCRAFYAQQSLNWDQEDVLTKLREFWNISNQTHSTITQEMRSDPDVVAVRNGGMPTRLGRTKTGIGGAAPAPSLGHMPPPPARPRQAPAGLGGTAAAASLAHADSDEAASSPLVSDYSEEDSRSSARARQQRAQKRKGGGSAAGGEKRSHKKKAAAAAGGGKDGSMIQPQPSFRRAPSRPAAGGGLGTPMGAMGVGGGMAGAVGMGGAAAGGIMPRTSSGVQRSRSTRLNGGLGVGGAAADPLGYVGRRLWRFWPSETPPWVEGFVQQWDPDTDGYTIVYDPNTRESTEEVFHFGTAIEGTDYVVGEYVDMAGVHGSRRQQERPYVPPEVLAAAPPPGLLAGLAPPPSKKRKSTSGAPVPADAPFEPTYLNARLPVAAEDELQQMLSVLERKERIVEAEINILEYQEANHEDIERRAELERRFQALCDREAQLMAEIAALREVAAV